MSLFVFRILRNLVQVCGCCIAIINFRLIFDTAFTKLLCRLVIVLPEQIESGCYGGYISIDCGTQLIGIRRELYGRQPQQLCFPSPSGTDCAVEGSFYRDLCNGKTSCRHLGIGFKYINVTGCVDVYTNYVHLVYRCYRPTGWFSLVLHYNTLGGGGWGEEGDVRRSVATASDFTLFKIRKNSQNLVTICYFMTFQFFSKKSFFGAKLALVAYMRGEFSLLVEKITAKC